MPELVLWGTEEPSLKGDALEGKRELESSSLLDRAEVLRKALCIHSGYQVFSQSHLKDLVCMESN